MDEEKKRKRPGQEEEEVSAKNLIGSVMMVNHHCTSYNAEYARLGNGKIGIRAISDIQKGQEILVHYGKGPRMKKSLKDWRDEPVECHCCDDLCDVPDERGKRRMRRLKKMEEEVEEEDPTDIINEILNDVVNEVLNSIPYEEDLDSAFINAMRAAGFDGSDGQPKVIVQKLSYDRLL